MDAYPQDDRALDALHPFAKEEEETAEWARQMDYEELLTVLRAVPEHSILGALTDALCDEHEVYVHRSGTEAIAEFAAQHGWRLTLKTVADFLPAKAVSDVLPS